MIVIGLILTRRKHSLKNNQQGIQTGNKFVLSMILTTLAYVSITLVCRSGAPSALLSPLYIIPTYLLFSFAELLLSPVGLSAITMLASPKKVSTIMGIFFVSLGIGGFLSGKLAELTAIPIGETSTMVLKAHYAASFTQLLYILMGATLLCVLLNLVIKYLMKKSPTIAIDDKGC